VVVEAGESEFLEEVGRQVGRRERAGDAEEDVSFRPLQHNREGRKPKQTAVETVLEQFAGEGRRERWGWGKGRSEKAAMRASGRGSEAELPTHPRGLPRRLRSRRRGYSRPRTSQP